MVPARDWIGHKNVMTSKLSQDNVTAENHDLKFNFSEFSWSKSHLKAYDTFTEMLYSKPLIFLYLLVNF